MQDFDSFYNELTSDEIWFESIKMTHPGKDWPLAAKQIYTGYLAEKFIPEMKEVRKHLNNKLIYQQPKPQRVETNYQHEKKEDDFNNPLTEEQKKVIDKLLEDYKGQILNDFKVTSIFDIEDPEKEGAERMPIGTGYRFDPDTTLVLVLFRFFLRIIAQRFRHTIG